MIKENITNCKYLQDKSDGITCYVVCQVASSFWQKGQIIKKYKDNLKAVHFMSTCLFAGSLIIVPIDQVHDFKKKLFLIDSA